MHAGCLQALIAPHGALNYEALLRAIARINRTVESLARNHCKMYILQTPHHTHARRAPRICALFFFRYVVQTFFLSGAARRYVDRDAEEMAPDADFKPNVINTVVFIVCWVMQVNVFASDDARSHTQ